MDSNVLLAPLGFLGMYMLLESCDWGLSLVAPFACRNQEENEAVLGVMKPGIDGNEAWFFLGLVLMGAAVPIAGGVSPFPVALLMGLVGLGALLRIAGCYGRKSLGSSLVMKGLCAFSVISMGAFGLFAGSLVSADGGMFSALGIVSALWCILAAFQVGALFGAAKIVNPLGERFRAAFLVSSVLSLVLFLATAMVLGGAVGDVPFFWAGLGLSVVLQVAAFFLTRMRQVMAGLAALYVSFAASLALYFAGIGAGMEKIHGAHLASTGAEPDTMILAAVTGWTVAVFLWRLSRKKESYEWKDHI